MSTDELENALAFAASTEHSGNLRVCFAQAKSACRTLASEVERLRAESAYQTAAAAYFKHSDDCCGGCTECKRLYAQMQAAEKAR